MAPWKIVLQPQKVSRAARVSGMVGIRETPSNCFYNLLQSVTFLHFCMKYKNTNCMFQSFQSINRYYKYYINTPLNLICTISANNKALTWLNRCIPMEDNTMYCPP